MIFIAIVGCCADFKEPGLIGPELAWLEDFSIR